MQNYVKLLGVLGLGLWLGLGTAAHAAKTQLTIWEDIQKSQGINQAIVDFEQENDVRINIHEMTMGIQLQKLREAIAAEDELPDIICIPNDQIGSAVADGLVRPISFMKTEGRNYTPLAVEAFTVNGEIYGVPKAVETIVLFYNKDLLPKPFNTLDEYYEFSKQVHGESEEKFGLLANWDSFYYAYGLMYPYGGYLFKKDADGKYDPSDIGLANEGAVEIMSYVNKFYREGLFPEAIRGSNGVGALDELFRTKKAAAVISGPWNLAPYANAGVNYGITTLPKLPNGKDMSSFVGVKGYVVLSASKHPELAEKLIAFLNKVNYARIRYEETREIPPIKAVMADSKLRKDPTASSLSMQSNRGVLMPAIPEMGAVWNIVDPALQKCASGEQDVKTALEGAVTKINEAVKSNH